MFKFTVMLTLSCVQVYVLQLQRDRGAWRVARRYNSFHALNDEVRVLWRI